MRKEKTWQDKPIADWIPVRVKVTENGTVKETWIDWFGHCFFRKKGTPKHV